MWRLGLGLLLLLTSARGDGPRRVLLVHFGRLRQDSGGDLHVYFTAQALRDLGFEVTVGHRDVLQLPPDYVPSEPVTGKDQLIAEVPMRLHIAESPEYFAVIEFLWMGLSYLDEIRAVNRMFRELSPRTVVIVVNPDIIHIHQGHMIKHCGICKVYYRYEMSLWRSADIIAGVNEELNLAVKRLLPDATLGLAPYAQPPLNVSQVPWSLRSDVIYFGSPFGANRLSVEHLVVEVLPALWKQHKATLHIYGGFQEGICRSKENCVVHGKVEVEVLHEAVRRSRWMVAPVQTNVGVSTKIVTALSLGTPVITTPFGLGGMEITNDSSPLVISSLQNFSSTVLSVYDNEALWREKQAVAASFAEKNFGLRRLRERISDIMSKADTFSSKRIKPLPNSKSSIKVAWQIPTNNNTVLSTISRVFRFMNNVISIHMTSPCVGDDEVFDIYVGLQETLNPSRPICCPANSCSFIIFANWQRIFLSNAAIKSIQRNVDAIWAPLSYQATALRKRFKESFVRLVPFGISCEEFLAKKSFRDIRAELQLKPETLVVGCIIDQYTAAYIGSILEAFPPKNNNVDYSLVFFARHSNVEVISSTINVSVVYDSLINNLDIYRAVDVLLLPFGSDLSLYHLEALIVGKPIIAPFGGIVHDYLTNYQWNPLYRLTAGETKKMPIEFSCSQLRDDANLKICSAKVEWLGLAARSLRMELKNAPMFKKPKGKTQRNAPDYVCQQFGWNRLANLIYFELNRAMKLHHT